MRDVLELPVRLLSAMPLATSLELKITGLSAPRIVWTTSGKAWEAARARRAAAWAPDEFEAFSLAVELGRAGGRDLARWSERKTVGHGLHVDARVALQGAEGLVPYFERTAEVKVGRGEYERTTIEKIVLLEKQRSPTWTLGRVFAVCGVELVGVEVHPPTAKQVAESIGRASKIPADERIEF